jgi:hypothetical protein
VTLERKRPSLGRSVVQSEERESSGEKASLQKKSSVKRESSNEKKSLLKVKNETPLRAEGTAKKGQRGKKMCPSCSELMPIHCQFCKNCNYEFHMNHKPKKIKEVFTSETQYSLEQATVNPKNRTQLILSRCSYYGNSAKNLKRERIVLPSPNLPLPLSRLSSRQMSL